jgi:hypothetical protein
MALDELIFLVRLPNDDEAHLPTMAPLTIANPLVSISL